MDRRLADPPATADAGIDTAFDPEAAPDLPSASLAAGAAVQRPRARGVLDTYGGWSLSWPVMMSQALLNAVGLVESRWSVASAPRRCGRRHATQFFQLSQSVLFAVGSACVALMAQAIGASDPVRARRALAASLMVAMGFGHGARGPALAAPAVLLRALAPSRPSSRCAFPISRWSWARRDVAVSLTLEFAHRADRKTRTPMASATVVTACKIARTAR